MKRHFHLSSAVVFIQIRIFQIFFWSAFSLHVPHFIVSGSCSVGVVLVWSWSWLDLVVLWSLIWLCLGLSWGGLDYNTAWNGSPQTNGWRHSGFKLQKLKSHDEKFRRNIQNVFPQMWKSCFLNTGRKTPPLSCWSKMSP